MQIVKNGLLFAVSVLLMLSQSQADAALWSPERVAPIVSEMLQPSAIDFAETFNPGLQYHSEVCHQPLSGVSSVGGRIAEISQRLQFQIFGEERFALRTCMVRFVVTDIGRKIVYFENDFIEHLGTVLPSESFEELIAVILGHEFGHSIYEGYVRVSPQENISWFSSELDGEEKNLVHAQIDVIGFELAQRAGFNVHVAEDVLSHVAENLTSNQTKVGITDQSVRQAAITDYLQYLRSGLTH